MAARAKNPNLSRRPLPGMVASLLSPVLRPLLSVLKKNTGVSGVTIYASYMVGDFFMALPALLFLKKSGSAPVRVLCRPDCAGFLTREGITAIPFTDSFRVRPSLATFFATARAAWNLRGQLGGEVVDLDADPRTALWLKIAGVRHTVSYRRSSGSLFDETFELPDPSVHQADRDQRVVEWVIRRQAAGGGRQLAAGSNDPERSGIQGFESDQLSEIPSSTTARRPPPAASSPWLLSVWTRKASKNWPLDRWESLMEKMLAGGIGFSILEPPDGDEAYKAFRTRWEARHAVDTPFVRSSLTELSEAVEGSTGVIATDNFLGHMAGYYGKPVLWINRHSPAHQVLPRGPRTIAVPPAGEEGQGDRPSVDEVWEALRNLRGT